MDSERTKTEALARLREAASVRALLIDYMQQREPLPAELFHYTSADGLCGIIDSGTIWLTNAAYVNDENELAYPVRLARQVVQSFNASEFTDRHVAFLGWVSSLIEAHTMYKTWYIASFTTEGNSLSQWRAYCPIGGYSVGFDARRLKARLPHAPTYSIGKVIYDQSLQVERIKAVLRGYVSAWQQLRAEYSDLEDEEYDREVAAMCTIWLSSELIFFKIPAFASEGEWRMALRPTGDQRVRFRSRHGMLTPYLVGRLVPSDERLPLSRVLISPLGDIELSEHAAQSLLATNDYDVKIITPTYRLRF
jgi:hypothetical protein